MKNIIKLLFLLFIISISSCQRERCQHCSTNFLHYDDWESDSLRYSFASNYATSEWCNDYITQEIGSSIYTFNDSIIESYPYGNYREKSICGDELKETRDWFVEIDLDGDGIYDFRLYNSCRRLSNGNGPIFCFFC